MIYNVSNGTLNPTIAYLPVFFGHLSDSTLPAVSHLTPPSKVPASALEASAVDAPE